MGLWWRWQAVHQDRDSISVLLSLLPVHPPFAFSLYPHRRCKRSLRGCVSAAGNDILRRSETEIGDILRCNNNARAEQLQWSLS